MNVKNLTITNFWNTLKRNVLWVLIFLVIAQIAVFLFQKYIQVIPYEAQTEILVNVEQKKEANTDESIRNNIQLINTFSAVLQSSKLIDLVRKENKLDQTSKELSQNLTLKSDQNSLVFHVTFTDTDKKTVEKISASYAKVVQKEMPKLFKGSSIIILEKPEVTAVTSGYTSYLLAFIVSALLSFIFLLILCVMDQTIKSVEQLHDLGLTILGDIPKLKIVEQGKGGRS